MREGCVDVSALFDGTVRFLMDADEILGFDYSCLILFGALAVIPIATFVILRVVRNSHAV